MEFFWKTNDIVRFALTRTVNKNISLKLLSNATRGVRYRFNKKKNNNNNTSNNSETWKI